MRTRQNTHPTTSRLTVALSALLAAACLPAMAADPACLDPITGLPTAASTNQGNEGGTDNATCHVYASTYGSYNIARGSVSNAFGNSNIASGVYSSAFGYRSIAQNTGSTSISFAAIADRDYTVAVGQSGAEHQIIHMADGTEDLDAVNVRQLRTLATWMGGGASFTDGVFTAPTFSIQGSNYSSVFAAFAAVDVKLTALVGSAGVPGPAGPTGSTGAAGVTGANSVDGADGASAY